MKKKIMIMVIFLITLFLINACSTSKKAPSLSDLKDSSGSLDISGIKSMRKLVFSLPGMDKKMCETFPKTIVSTIEEQKGVIDTSFDYDGHIVTVYYAPDFITKEDIMNNDVYSWVGTKFISDDDADISKIRDLYDSRKANDNLVMPSDHMKDDPGIVLSGKLPALVSPDWLSKNLENVKIIEIGPKELYDKGHAMTAVNIDISEIRAEKESVTGLVLDKEDFETFMGRKGIKKSDRVVIYSSASLDHASRLYWTMKYYEHDDVAIVDGGKESLKGFVEFNTDTPVISKSTYTALTDNSIFADSGYVKQKSDDNSSIIIDVRTPEEYAAGHIPGAININWLDLLNADNTLKTKNKLNDIFRGLSPDKKIIVYCRSGTRASYAWLVLSKVLGYKDVRLYDGSMIDWSIKNMPLEK